MKTVTALAVAKLRRPGRHRCGNNLYLQIGENGARSWIVRYQFGGRARHMGIGATDLLTLAEAREKAVEARRLLLDGIDPLVERERRRQQASVAAASMVTFRECAERYIAAHEPSWRSRIHRNQWQSSLARFVYPVFGAVAVADVDTGLVMQVLEPLWMRAPATASRVRGRIESILDFAKARGYRESENCARWRGHLENLLPHHRKLQAVKHFAALAYADVAALLVALRAEGGIAAVALEFAVLTAARTGEVIGATWDEINEIEKIWTIGAGRMKGGREHRIPLSARAVELLTRLPRQGEFVFAGKRAGTPLGPTTLRAVMQRVRPGASVHGLRSSFRDWAAEQTNYPREVAEAALAHAISNAVEAAYRRTDFFERRRRLMEDWSRYCSAPTLERGAVVPLRTAR
jgi:integrase